ncbi:MAG TPA: hypothetical protein PL058_01400, partial [Bacilli bacterium]|nr:hypothetical protein [Bacilli bacterium]
AAGDIIINQFVATTLASIERKYFSPKSFEVLLKYAIFTTFNRGTKLKACHSSEATNPRRRLR